MPRATHKNTLRYILIDNSPYYHDTYVSAQKERLRLQKNNPHKEFRLLKIIGCHGVPSSDVINKVKSDSCAEMGVSNPDNEYLIWNDERKKWWEENYCGYTSNINNAGTYTRDQARAIVVDAMIGPSILNDVMILKSDALALVDMRVEKK